MFQELCQVRLEEEEEEEEVVSCEVLLSTLFISDESSFDADDVSSSFIAVSLNKDEGGASAVHNSLT